MKKKLLLILLFTFSSNVIASSMGTYKNLIDGINAIEKEPNTLICKNEFVTLSKQIISAANQTMAETIMLMLVDADKNKKSIICVPKNFYLGAREIEDLIMKGFDHSKAPNEEKYTMPAAVFAIMELHRQYPC